MHQAPASEMVCELLNQQTSIGAQCEYARIYEYV